MKATPDLHARRCRLFLDVAAERLFADGEIRGSALQIEPRARLAKFGKVRFFSENKNADGYVKCAETGELITRDQAHMDHRPPLTFEVIVTTFLASRGLSLKDVPLTSGQDEQVSPEIADEPLRQAFREYHARVALLDLVKSAVNLAQSARHRLKPARPTDRDSCPDSPSGIMQPPVGPCYPCNY
jgi:hypothetical protein